jgi:methionyl aminopeptidase
MIHLKTKKEIEIMRIGGKILAEVLTEVIKNVKVGISELELDRLAEKLIIQKGGESGFKKVDGYKHTICISTNDVVVHGIPTNYRLKAGDKVGVDCGVFYKGFHTDMAQSAMVKGEGLNDKYMGDVSKFLKAGEKAMWAGIKAAKFGNRIGDISKAVQDIVEGQGYSVVRSLVGHGVGKELHEDPEVPGFLDRPILKTPLLKEGMVIAVEVIYNMGKKDVVYSNDDGWTIKTKDGSLSGLFERTISISKGKTSVLTQGNCSLEASLL